jgi:hypothetical protein
MDDMLMLLVDYWSRVKISTVCASRELANSVPVPGASHLPPAPACSSPSHLLHVLTAHLHHPATLIRCGAVRCTCPLVVVEAVDSAVAAVWRSCDSLYHRSQQPHRGPAAACQ